MSRESHQMIIDGKLYLKMDASGRLNIPTKMYLHHEDTRLRYDVSAPTPNVLQVVFRRHLPYANEKLRIYILPKIREQYGYDASSLFECQTIENGFILTVRKESE